MKKNLEEKNLDVMNEIEIQRIYFNMLGCLDELIKKSHNFFHDPEKRLYPAKMLLYSFLHNPEEILLYSVAEFSIICCRNRSGYSDLCGLAFSTLTGSNKHCCRIVESIIKNDTDYKEIAGLVQLDSEISKCGTIFKNNIKGSQEDIEDLLIFLHYYREIYLPAIYEFMNKNGPRMCGKSFKGEYFENTIKAIQRTAKSLIDKLEAYLEVRAIL
jgi:hypothetical protein